MAALGCHSSAPKKQHILFMDEYVSCKDYDLSLVQKGVMSHVCCVQQVHHHNIGVPAGGVGWSCEGATQEDMKEQEKCQDFLFPLTEG